MNYQNSNDDTQQKVIKNLSTDFYKEYTQFKFTDKSYLKEIIRKDDILHFIRINPINFLCNISSSAENYTLFHLAARYNSFRLMTCFLLIIKQELDFDLNFVLNLQESEHGDTPAMICVKNGNPETLIILLMEKRININLKNKAGMKLEDLVKAGSSACEYVHGKDWTKNPLTAEDKKHISPSFGRFFENSYHILTDFDFLNLKNYTHDSKYNPGKFIENGWNQVITSKADILDPEVHAYSKVKKIIWLRYHQVLKKQANEIALFDLNWSIGNIIQGDLENCYLIATLISLSQYPRRLLKIFSSEKFNPNGLFSLHLYDRGIPKVVIIDDFVPVLTTNKKKPLFCSTVSIDLWPILIEKAFAMIYGSYFACEYGYSDEAIETLLGCPGIQVVLSSINEESLWEYITKAFKKNFILTATTLKNTSQTSSLPDSHAFAFISFYELSGLKLLKLRDPRNSLKWKGDYHAKSKFWTSDMLNEVGDISSENGLLCLSLKELKMFFEYISIGIYEEDYYYDHIEVISDQNKEFYAALLINEPSHLYLRLHQEDLRKIYKKAAKKSDYSPAELFIARLEENGDLTPIVLNSEDLDATSVWGARTIFATDAKILSIPQPGQYVIRGKLLNKSEEREVLTLSTYSSSRLKLKRIDSQKDFLERFLSAIGRTSTSKKEITKDCCRAEGFYGNYCWFFFQNKGDKIFKIKFQIFFLENLEFLDPEDEKKEIRVGQGSSSVLILRKRKISKTASYQMKWNYTFE